MPRKQRDTHRPTHRPIEVARKSGFKQMLPETRAGLLVTVLVTLIIVLIYVFWLWPEVLSPRTSSVSYLPLLLVSLLVVFGLGVVLGCIAGLKLDDLIDKHESRPVFMVEGEVTDEYDDEDIDFDGPEAAARPVAPSPTPRRPRPPVVTNVDLYTHREKDDPEPPMVVVDPEKDPTTLRGWTTRDDHEAARPAADTSDGDPAPAETPAAPIRVNRGRKPGRRR